jgi:hypothetical protein
MLFSYRFPSHAKRHDEWSGHSLDFYLRQGIFSRSCFGHLNREVRMRAFASLLTLLVMFASLAAGQSGQTMTVKVYFSNNKTGSGFDDCAKVHPLTRTIPQTSAVARAALEQLFRGPTVEERAQGYFSWFSEETKSALLGVKVKNKTAYVNLKDITQTITSASSSCGSTILLAQMEHTLKQFPTIERAFFAIEGSPEDFYGFLQMECPDELKNCDRSNFK